MPEPQRTTRDTVELCLFGHYLRTGQRLDLDACVELFERKFNPYHDEIGRFATPTGAVAVSGSSAPGPAPARQNRDAPARTGSSPQRRVIAPSRPVSSSRAFQSEFMQEASPDVATPVVSFFDLRNRQAYLDQLRRKAGPNPGPLIKADLDEYQNRLNAARVVLIERAKIADREVNEILRMGLAPVDIAEGVINIARSEAELRDYIAVAGAIPIAGVVGKLGKFSSVAKPAAVVSGQAAEVAQLGGSYSAVRKLRGYHAHHMPANKASPLSKGKGPSVAMLPDDHIATISYGSGKLAKAHQATQKKLISEGKFQEAQALDIADLKQKFGSKYDKAIEEMVNHTKNKGY